ncbi:MAG: hypothetical protein ABL984_16520 [Pyrinomonadaceae bacterium]
MKENHKNVFFAAAQQFTCWIGLREPNELSAKWIGQPRYVPKMEECKAKSADNASHRFGGLVVDPTICPEAFTATSLQAAIRTWQQKFLKGNNLPPGFFRAENGPEKGLVKFNGSAIYADFDLMAINRSNLNGDFLTTSQNEQKELFAKVAPMLNQGLGAKLIQHGAEFMWDKGLGARESEFVLWFGPGRRFRQTMSSMPQGGH